MILLDQRIIGIAILFLLAMLVTVKQVSTGSILDKPQGNLLIQFVNIFNLFFLLVVNPLAAILLIARLVDTRDPTHITIDPSWLQISLEIAGLCLYIMGFLLMIWALLSLARNYQLGGSAPRATDEMIVAGPYRFVRHPMYTAVLSISLGLACLVQSLALFLVFCVYLVLILFLIPVEEEGLAKAYPGRYSGYQKKVKKLVPSLY